MAEPADRRQAPRIALVQRPRGRALDTLVVWLVDLSTKGARIKLDEQLHHGCSLTLELPSTLGSLRLSSRIVWTAHYGRELTPDGEHHPIYLSGVAFVGLTPDQQAVLEKIVQDLIQGRRRAEKGL